MSLPSFPSRTSTLPGVGTRTCRGEHRTIARWTASPKWRVTDTGWLQVSQDAGRAGNALVNLAVDDLDAHLEGLVGRGLAPGDVQTVTKGVQLSSITDPDGNTITFIGNFRVNY